MDNKDKQALIDGTATIPYKLHILNDDGSIKDTLTEEDIVSTDYEDYRYVDSSSLCIGQFVARKLKGEIKTIDKDLQIEDKEISVEMGVNRNDGSKVYDITIDGKSEQETTKGNQLIDFSNYKSISDNSTYKFENDTITLTTQSGKYNNVSWSITDIIKNNVGKTLYFDYDSLTRNSGSGNIVQLVVSYTDNTKKYPVLVNSNSVRVSYKIPDDVSNISHVTFAIYGNNSSTEQKGNLIITKPMLQFGTSKLEYEPYTGGQPSPSPDYPSEIKSVEGIENLFDKNKYISLTSNGITATITQDYINVKGTATANAFITWQLPKIIKNGTVVTMSANNNEVSTSTNTFVRLCYGESVTEDGTITRIPLNIANNSKTFTTTHDDDYLQIRVNRGDVLDINLKIQIEKGSISHDYVPYGHWLKVTNTGKNLCNGINQKYYLNTAVNLAGLVTGNSGLVIPTNGKTTFTISTNIIQERYRVACINNLLQEEKSTTTAYNGVNKDGTNASITIDTTGYKYLVVNATDLTQIQVEKGSTATEYEPYKETSTLIDMNKANLFDKDNANEIDGFVNGNTGLFTAPTNRQKSIYIEIEPNTTYTVFGFQRSTNIGTFTEIPVAGTSTATKKVGGVYSWTFTSGSNDKYLVCMYNAAGANYTYNDVKLYEGVGTDDYYELSSIGDTKDELNIDKEGNVSIKQNIGEVVLDGSESNWIFRESNTNTLRATCDGLTGIKGYSLVMSPELPGYRNNSAIGAIDSIGIAPRDNGLGFTLRLPVNVATDVNTLKTYLSSNPVTVYYELAEPQTIELPRINKIESIDNTENISIVTNIPTTFQITEFPLVNWYNLGNFLITKPTDDDVKGTLTFDSMDYTKKFNQTFDSTNIIFPCTALELAKYCCEQCGVELATTDFINNDFEVIDNQYTEEDTYRNVMQDIGKLAYSWIRIGWDNKCYIDFNYGEEVDEYNKIDNDNYYDLDLQQKQFGPVNRIVIGMSNVEGENVYIEDEKSIVEHGVTELQIYDNNLTYTPELRNKVIDSAKVLFGLTYTPMTLNTTGHPWLLGKEKVEVTGMNNTIYYTYPWDRTISYSGHIKSKLESKCDTKTETEYKYKGDVESVLKKTRIIVNKQENTITSLTQQTTSIQDDLQQNYYDKTQTNQLIQTSGEGITNTFSEAGGNNIFRNTGLWFEDSSTSYYIYPKSDLYPSNQTFTNGQRAYEFWDGLVLKKYYDKAANLTAISLQNGYLEQKQQVPNGNYTVSFKYKKLIESATTKVIINNVEYNLTKLQDTEFRTGEQDSDGNYITQPLEVTDGYIFVRFYTNVNNSTIIYDLMVNAGSVKLAYSQNQNETTTDTVNISKGITITSSNTDTTFKANSDGIRTLNKNNETLSEFTDKGMKNKQIEVTDEATIVQVLWQNVGDQTWLTRL